MLRSCWEKRAWSPKSQWYRQPNWVFSCRSRTFISGGSAIATSAAPTVAPAVTSAPTTLRRSTFFIALPLLDAGAGLPASQLGRACIVASAACHLQTSLTCQTPQPGFRPRCLELQRALVPMLCFRRVGFEAAHVPACELVRILRLGHFHCRDREPQIGGADVILARDRDVALRHMAIADLDQPLRGVEILRRRRLAVGRGRRRAARKRAGAAL